MLADSGPGPSRKQTSALQGSFCFVTALDSLLLIISYLGTLVSELLGCLVLQKQEARRIEVWSTTWAFSKKSNPRAMLAMGKLKICSLVAYCCSPPFYFIVGWLVCLAAWLAVKLFTWDLPRHSWIIPRDRK